MSRDSFNVSSSLSTYLYFTAEMFLVGLFCFVWKTRDHQCHSYLWFPFSNKIQRTSILSMLVNHFVNCPDCQGDGDRIRTGLARMEVAGRKQKLGKDDFWDTDGFKPMLFFFKYLLEGVTFRS